MELINSDLLEKYNSLKQKHVEIMERMKEFEKKNDTRSNEGEKQSEEPDVEVIVQQKQSGFRRTTPAEPSAPATNPSVKPKPKKCVWCPFKTTDSITLDKHLGEKHHRCDECQISFKTPWSLREHNKNIHKNFFSCFNNFFLKTTVNNLGFISETTGTKSNAAESII